MSGTTPQAAITEADIATLAGLVDAIATGEQDIADTVGLTDNDLETIYAAGHGLYSAGKYKDARDFFNVLCMCRRTDSRFWFGLGGASQMLGDNATAVKAYGLAALFNLEDPQVPLRAAECLIRMGEGATARQALDAVDALTEGKPEYASYVERARLMRARLDSEKSKS